MYLVIDNYDSFVYNLVSYFMEEGCEVKVIRSEDMDEAEILSLIFQKELEGIVISPGPKSPKDYPRIMELLDGILRRFLIAIHGGEIKETILTKEDLLEAEELFLTNSLMGIMPVRSLDGKRYLTGGKGSKLSEYYNTLLQTLPHSNL